MVLVNRGLWQRRVLEVFGKEMVPTLPLSSNNIYMSVNISLACPLEHDIVLRLRTFLSSTYWRNEEAMECVFAASTAHSGPVVLDRASCRI